MLIFSPKTIKNGQCPKTPEIRTLYGFWYGKVRPFYGKVRPWYGVHFGVRTKYVLCTYFVRTFYVLWGTAGNLQIWCRHHLSQCEIFDICIISNMLNRFQIWNMQKLRASSWWEDSIIYVMFRDDQITLAQTTFLDPGSRGDLKSHLDLLLSCTGQACVRLRLEPNWISCQMQKFIEFG